MTGCIWTEGARREASRAGMQDIYGKAVEMSARARAPRPAKALDFAPGPWGAIVGFRAGE